MSKSLKKPDGTFAPGWRGGGRPKGARAKLHELAVEMLRDDFEMHGREVIARVREKKPEVYLASVVSLLPRQHGEKRPQPDAAFQPGPELAERIEMALLALRVGELWRGDTLPQRRGEHSLVALTPGWDVRSSQRFAHTWPLPARPWRHCNRRPVPYLSCS
jgi:hypothetical protein